MEKEIEKYNWKYYYKDISENEIEVIVTPDKADKQPDYLYKLFGLNKNAVNPLINLKLYATHPYQFNDIFDCNEDLIDFDDDNVIKSFFKGTVSIKDIEKQLNKDRQNAERFVKEYFTDMLYKKWGILSMTSNPNNIVMWSYYNKHQGFCVEFDYTKFPFRYYGPFPINYQKKIDPISVKESGLLLSVIYQTNIKSICWEQENEWRIILDAEKDVMISPKFKSIKVGDERERLFSYPIEAINSISLGNRFFELEEIKEIDNETLEINLDSDTADLKESLLEFICINEIKCYIALRSKDLVSIVFRQGNIENIDKLKYIFEAE